ncbi:MAG: histidine kinase [Actinomyces sp.]|uniref:sensor histidine kinase n=1 Tax=Actinomyces sp. TaxID=29317 RepID=UPI0026DCA207|nr:histidine kinase [Actinomyces sp.]MDO4242867.1 histidine kinase [Actinomyces sp.]
MRSLPLPAVPDVIAAALISVGAWLSAPQAAAWLPASTVTPVWAALIVVAALAVLARSRAPLTVVVVLGLVLAVHLAAFAQPSVMMLVLAALAAWTTQSRLSSPWRWLVLAALYLGALPAIARVLPWISVEARTPLQGFIILVTAWSILTTAALAGAARRRARERVEQAIERAEMLQAQQDTERRLAVSRERTRIARDVHDLLGHSLAVIGMQAAGAQAVLRTDPDAAQEALAVIGGTARRSVEEVRALIDVLREDAPGEDGHLGAAPGTEPVPQARHTRQGVGPTTADAPVQSLAAQQVPAGTAAPARPGLDELPALVSTFRDAGMEVGLGLEVSAAAPEEAGRVLHEVVREALTNVARHAPGSPARVEARATSTRLEVEVSNGAPAADSAAPAATAPVVTAPGRIASATAAHAAPAGAVPPQPRRGYGLESMSGRVKAIGGCLIAGPREGGSGWRVLAAVPAGAGS